MSDEQEVTEVPVLEIDFAKFLQICEKINIVDSCKFFSMPDHAKKYSDRTIMPISELMTMLLDFEKEENSWRAVQKTVQDLNAVDGKIIIGDKILFDSNRVIIISRLNSAYIVPGERSIKEGGFMPNEIVKLSNLISSQLFLLRFSDVPDEKNGGFDLKVEYSLIDRTRIQSNHATQN